MKLIDRLLMTVERPKCWLALAIIEYDIKRQQHKLSCSLWDGRAGSGGKTLVSYHDTGELAEAELAAIGKKYPGTDSVLWIDDISPCKEREAHGEE